MGISGSMLPPNAPSFFLPRSCAPRSRAPVDQVLDDGEVPHVGGHHQRGDAGVVGPVDVGAELDQQLDHGQPFGERFALAVAVDPAVAGRGQQRRLVVAGTDVAIGAVVEQKLHQLPRSAE